MKFKRHNPAQLEGVRLAADECCYALSERIRLAAGAVVETMTDGERQAVANGLLRVPFVDGMFKATRQTARRLSRAETIAFIENPPHLLNGGERLPAGKRGARTKRTHYDLRHERLKGRYHRIKRLPEAGADARRGAGESLRAFILRLVESEARLIPETTPERDLTGLVMRAIQFKRHQFDHKAIRRALRQLGRIKE